MEKQVEIRLWGALTNKLRNLDISLFLVFIFSFCPSYIFVYLVPLGDRGPTPGHAGKMLRSIRQRVEQGGVGGGHNKQCLLLSASTRPVFLLCLSPMQRISRGFEYWGYVGSGSGWEEGLLVFLSSWASHPIKKPPSFEFPSLDRIIKI